MISSRVRRAFLRAADPTNERSLSNRLRARRFAVIEQLFREEMSKLDRPVRVLDVGGTADYWMKRSLNDTDLSIADDERVEVTLVNTDYHEFEGSHPRVPNVIGDGRALEFAEAEFDVVVSNSTMEHVGNLDQQRRMASEVQRVGRRMYVQVPCRWFPIDPHMGVPFYAVLPSRAKVWLIRHVDMGHAGKETDRKTAERRAADAHLLTARQTIGLFSPPVEVHRERVLGLTKSVAVVGEHRVTTSRGSQ